MIIEVKQNAKNEFYTQLQIGSYDEGAVLNLMVSGPAYVDAEKFFAAFSNLLADKYFDWSRQPIFDMENRPDWQYFSGNVKVNNTLFGISLAYKKLSLTNALIRIEDVEGDVLPSALVSALISGERAMRYAENKKIPRIFISIIPRACTMTLSGRGGTGRKPPLPPPLTESEMLRMVREVDHSFFDGTAFRAELANLHSVIEMMLPKLKNARTTDYIRTIVVFARYLWNDEWWSSSKLRGFANSTNSALASIIEMLSSYENYFLGPTFNYKGYPVLIGTNHIDDYWNLVDEDNFRRYVTTNLRSWLQFVELYANDCPVEVLKSMLPNRSYVYTHLGLDVKFYLEDEKMLLSLAESLIESANENAAYAPFGFFSVPLPPDIVSRIADLEFEPTVMPDGTVLDWGIDFNSMQIWAEPDQLWVRLVGEQGRGPIIHWSPTKPPMDNLLSQSFGIFLNAILAALWHDLRVAGPASFFMPGHQKQVKPSSHEPRQTSRRSTPKKSRGLSAASGDNDGVARPGSRYLPRSGGQTRFEVRKGMQWAGEEERNVIRKRLHGVSGFPRRLPPGQKPSEQALKMAEYFGVVLPKGKTFVRPHVRGKRGAEAEAIPESNPVVSKGLATIMLFLESKRKDDSEEKTD